MKNLYFVTHGRQARRNRALSFHEARSAYRPEPSPDAFDCMGGVFGWPLVISVAFAVAGVIAFHAIRG